MLDPGRWFYTEYRYIEYSAAAPGFSQQLAFPAAASLNCFPSQLLPLPLQRLLLPAAVLPSCSSSEAITPVVMIYCKKLQKRKHLEENKWWRGQNRKSTMKMTGGIFQAFFSEIPKIHNLLFSARKSCPDLSSLLTTFCFLLTGLWNFKNITNL